MERSLFLIGAFHSLLVHQGQNWESHIRPSMRFFLFWCTWIYAGGVAYTLSQLPQGSMEFLLGNIFNPLAVFLLFAIATISMLGAGAVVIADIIKRTL